MSEGEAQKITNGEITKKMKKGGVKDKNFFSVIEETVRLVEKLKKS